MSKVRLLTGKFSNFYSFYEEYQQKPLRSFLFSESDDEDEPKFGGLSTGKSLDVDPESEEHNTNANLAAQLISSSDLKRILDKTNPKQYLLIKGSPGQGKSTIIEKFYKQYAESKGLIFCNSSEDFYKNIMRMYKSDSPKKENAFLSECKNFIKTLQDQDVSHEVIDRLTINSVQDTQKVFRELIKVDTNDSKFVQFCNKYISSKFFISYMVTDSNEATFFTGQENITGKISKVTGETETYSKAFNEMLIPMYIPNIEILFFVDEITRIASSYTSSVNALNAILTSRKMFGKEFSDSVRFIMAGNFGKSEMGEYTRQLGEATAQRVIPLELSVNPDDFYEYFKNRYVDFKEGRVPSPGKFSEFGKNILGGEENLEKERIQTSKGSENEKLDVNKWNTSCKMAYNMMDAVIRYFPHLFMEDKKLIISSEEEDETGRHTLSRRGLETMTKRQKDSRFDQSTGLLKSPEDFDPTEQGDRSRREATSEYSSNRRLDSAMNSGILVQCMYYYLTVMDYNKQLKSDIPMSQQMELKRKKGEAMLDYQQSVTVLLGLGSVYWKKAMNDVLNGTAQILRTLKERISRSYKPISKEDKERIFGLTSEGDIEAQLDPLRDKNDIAKKNELIDVAVDEIVENQNPKERMKIFATLINSLKTYYPPTSKSFNEIRRRVVAPLVHGIRGNTEESKNNYIKFMLDYIFIERPSDAWYLINTLLNITPKDDGDEKTAFMQIPALLKSRENRLTDSEISAYELSHKYEKPENSETPPSDEEERKLVSKKLK